MKPTRGLGKGLSALFSETEEDYGKSLLFDEKDEDNGQTVSEIDIGLIKIYEMDFIKDFPSGVVDERLKFKFNHLLFNSRRKGE